MDRYYNLMPQTPENNKIRLALEMYDLRRNTSEPTYYLKHAVPLGVNRVKVGGSNCGANNKLLDRPMGMFRKELVGGSFPMMELDSAPFMARSRGGTAGRVRMPKGVIVPGSMARYPQYNMNEERYMQMQGAGAWEDMNAWGRQAEIDMNNWGKQNERNFMAFVGNKENQDTARAIANDPAVQKAAKDAASAVWKYATTPKKGKGIYSGGKILRGRGFDEIPDLESKTQAKNAGKEAALKIRKMMEDKAAAEAAMQGSGLWEDMNNWGKQNERNFNNFGKQVEIAVKDPNFGKDFAYGFNLVMAPAAAISAVIPGLQPLAPVFGAMSAVAAAVQGSGIPPRKRGGSIRASIVKDVMMKSGMTLPQASRYVKENNMY